MIIGLTGPRYVGKSTIANILVAEHGFVKGHAFQPGKAMCVAYYMYCGASEQEAQEMVNGSLKDTPSSYLPDDAKSRHFMEELGFFMGTHPALGPAWTIGQEIKKLQRTGHKDIILESLVYEEEWMRANYPIQVARIHRDLPTHEVIPGGRTDEAQEKILADWHFNNNPPLDTLGERIADWINDLRSTV